MSSSSILECLRGEYANYLKKVNAYLSKNGKSIMSLITGNTAFSNDSMHDEFYETIKVLISDFENRLNISRDVDETAARLSEEAKDIIYFMLLEDRGNIPEQVKWMFVAAERLATPLIDYISVQDKEMLYSAYKSRLKKERYLPFQKKLLKALK